MPSVAALEADERRVWRRRRARRSVRPVYSGFAAGSIGRPSWAAVPSNPVSR